MDHYRRRLEEERASLRDLRERLQSGHDLGRTQQGATSELSSVDQHPADAGTETFERAKGITVVEQAEAGLTEVERALRRLEDGSYGRCEACGRPIGEERLEHIPAARFCVEDQGRAEREARPRGAERPAAGPDAGMEQSR